MKRILRAQVPHPSAPRFQDLTGMRFGRLTAQFYVGRMGSNAGWRVLCDCGELLDTKATNLKRAMSCGCAAREQMSRIKTTHGATKNRDLSPEFKTWSGIIRRCTGEKSHAYKRYGARGISVCNRWRYGEDGKTAYECFLTDMGNKPSPDMSIDRYPDNDGDYRPGNCRWATNIDQQNNKSSNHVVEFRGEKMPITAAAALVGLNANTVFGRLKLGWSVDRALNTPAARRRDPRITQPSTFVSTAFDMPTLCERAEEQILQNT